MKLVNPSNRRKFKIIMVGSGLAGAAAAASLGEAGYNVECFCYQDSPRRAHSVAAQGGINAAKNYRNDGDSDLPLCSTTRSRAATIGRARPTSTGWPRSATTSSTSAWPRVCPLRVSMAACWTTARLAAPRLRAPSTPRGQTGQQLLLGAYQALERQIAAKTVTMYTRHEMLDLIVVNGRARGIVTRDMRTGKIEAHLADVVVLATGGYSNVFYLSTNAKGCNTTAIWRVVQAGRLFCQPVLTRRFTRPVSRRQASTSPS